MSIDLQLLASVAAELGFKVEPRDPEDSRHYVVMAAKPAMHGPAPSLYVTMPDYGPNKGRVVIAGRWPQRKRRVVTPRDVYVDGKALSDPGDITVAAKRGAAEIASEIRRRLLPAYITTHDAVCKRIAEWDAQEATCVARMTRLAATIGGGAKVDLGRDGDSPSVYVTNLGGALTTSSDGEIRIPGTFYVSEACAVAIAKLVAADKAKGAA